jgi:hypothetical protein
MSETTTLPFDSASAAPAAETEQRPDRRKLLLILAAGAVVFALLGYFVALPFLSGGTAKVPPAADAPARAAAGTAVPAKPKVVPKTFNDVIGRDPFAPLVTAAAATAAAAGGTAAAAGGTAATTPATTTPATTAGKTTFKVITVTGSKAAVSVDAKKYTVSTGHVFATTYRLLKTTGGSCASFSYGEMRFSLCEGQTFIF